MSRKKVDIESPEIDLTSMIDVCFLLIAFFIMVTEVSKAEIVEIFLPTLTNAVPDVDPPDNRIIVNIDRRGGVFIRSSSFGTPNLIENKENITRYLRGISEAVGFETSEKKGLPVSKLTVYIRGDAHAQYRYVQCMMKILTDPTVKVIKVHYVAKNNEIPS